MLLFLLSWLRLEEAVEEQALGVLLQHPRKRPRPQRLVGLDRLRRNPYIVNARARVRACVRTRACARVRA